MFQILLQSEWILFVQKTNTLIYYIRKLPLIGRKIPSTIYQETNLKKLLGSIPVLWKLIWAFAGTFLYFLLMIQLPANIITEFTEAAGNPIDYLFLLLYLLFMLTFLTGSVMSSTLVDTNLNLFFLLHVMRIPATEYYRAKMLMRSFKDTICFLVPLFYSGFGIQSFLIVFCLIFTRYIGEWFILKCYLHHKQEKKKYWWKNGWFVICSSLLILVVTYGFPVLFPFLFRTEIFPLEIVIGILLFICGAKCFFIVWNFSGYTVFSKRNVSLKDYNELDDLKANAVTADIEINETSISKEELYSKEFEQKEGYDYLNALFFARHKHLVKRAVLSRIIIIAIIGAVGIIGLLLMNAGQKDKLWNLLTQMMPFFIFIMYIESTGSRLCKAMFFNCDVSLLKYGYYREADAILINFKIRLKKLLLLNIIPAILICIFLFIFTVICGRIGDIFLLLPVMLGVLLLSAFFCLFHLFMYYITQPYTEEKTVKSPIFSAVNALVYIACYICLQMQTGSWEYIIGVFVVTLIFIPVSYKCIYKYAPKTFHIK